MPVRSDARGFSNVLHPLLTNIKSEERSMFCLPKEKEMGIIFVAAE